MKKKKIIFLRVTTTHLYAFEDKSINRLDTNKVIEDWFNRYDIDAFHATRDSYKVGSSGIVTDIKEMSEEEERNYAQARKQYVAKISERKEEIMIICEKCGKIILDKDSCYQVRYGHWEEVDTQDPGNFEAEEDVAYYHEECYEK